MVQMTSLCFPGDVVEATLVKRYKRFLVDCVLATSGEEITGHTPNTGSMKGLVSPGNRVLLSYHDSPKRKLKYSLQAIQVDETWVGTNTMLPNGFVAQLIEDANIPSLRGYETLKREKKFGAEGKSRVDIFLSDHQAGAPDAFVEVKNVTLREGHAALFPDAVTTRGLKHIHELEYVIGQGARGALVFLVQRDDCTSFAPAKQIDPDYAQALQQAYHNGLEIIVCQARVDHSGVHFYRYLEPQWDA